MSNRYNTEQRIVTPLPASQTYQMAPAQVSQLMRASQPDTVVMASAPQSTIDNVFTPQSVERDAYSPLQRAVGLGVRSIPFVVVYLVLAIGIVNTLALAGEWLYLLFGIPLLLTVLYMSERTDRYTPAGVEIERIAAAERTEYTKGERQERILSQHLAHKQELARMALEASIKMLGGNASDRKQ